MLHPVRDELPGVHCLRPEPAYHPESPSSLNYEGFLGTLLATRVELVPDVYLPVLADLVCVSVEVPRGRPRHVISVDVVDPPMARAEELSFSLPHDPPHRTPQVGAGVGEDVEVILGLLDLLPCKRPSIVVIQKGGAITLPVRAVRQDLGLPGDPEGVRGYKLLFGDAALLLDLRVAVDLLHREIDLEVLRL